jgi:hypothetical protein
VEGANWKNTDGGLSRLRLALSKGPNRVGTPPNHLGTEKNTFSETLRSLVFLKYGRWTKPKNPEIPGVIHHRQNHLESIKGGCLRTGCQGEHLHLRKRKYCDNGVNFIMIFASFALHHILLERSNLFSGRIYNKFNMHGGRR